jgi:hypothetical protein
MLADTSTRTPCRRPAWDTTSRASDSTRVDATNRQSTDCSAIQLAELLDPAEHRKGVAGLVCALRLDIAERLEPRTRCGERLREPDGLTGRADNQRCKARRPSSFR